MNSKKLKHLYLIDIAKKIKKALHYEVIDEGDISYFKVYHNKETINIKQLKKQIEKSTNYKWFYDIPPTDKYANCLILLDLTEDLA
jgi:hypothetical protein